MSSLDINNTFGALLLATIISSILYGVTCMQTWNYFQNYSDGPLMKISVATLWILESLHSAFGIHAIYNYVISNYANPTALLKATWSAASLIIVSSLISAIVRFFYVWRVYIISRKNAPLAILIAVLCLVNLGAGLAVPIRALQLQYFSLFWTLSETVIPQDLGLASAVVVDVLIASSLTIYLHNSKTGISSTDKLINQLVVYTINNGILTSVAEAFCLAMGTAEPTNLIYFAIFACVGNLYTISMLATLNARQNIANSRGTSVGLSDLSASFRFGHGPTAARTMTVDAHKSMNQDFSDVESRDGEIDIHISQIASIV